MWEKYSPGHLCNKKGIYLIIGNDKKEDEFVEATIGSNNEINVEDIEEYGPSLNVMAENYAHNTIRIKGSYIGRNLVILFDNKSTRSFIDKCVVKKVKAIIKRTTILVVIMANKCDEVQCILPKTFIHKRTIHISFRLI